MKEGTLTNIVGVPTSVRTYEQALSECECVCVREWGCDRVVFV